MVVPESTTANRRIGTIAAGLGVSSLLCFLLVFALHNQIGVILFFGSPALSVLALALSIVTLIRAKRDRVNLTQKFWAELGLVSSLFAGACWIGFYIWLTAFVHAMEHHH
jgi:hypothetical protein